MGFAKEVAISVVADLIILAITAFLNFFGFVDLMSAEFPFWITLIAVLIIIPIFAIAARFPKKTELDVSFSGNPRPRNVSNSFWYKMYHVNWSILYGSQYTFSDPYFFVESNPYCPDCTCEMKAEKKGIIKKYHWKCERCGKFYECPKNDPYVFDKVKRLIESEFKSGRLKMQ